MSLGMKLRHLREGTGLSLEKLAEELGVSKTYLYYLESGNRKEPSFSMVENMARFFDVPIDFFSDHAKVNWKQASKYVPDKYKEMFQNKKGQVVLDLAQEFINNGITIEEAKFFMEFIKKVRNQPKDEKEEEAQELLVSLLDRGITSSEIKHVIETLFKVQY